MHDAVLEPIVDVADAGVAFELFVDMEDFAVGAVGEIDAEMGLQVGDRRAELREALIQAEASVRRFRSTIVCVVGRVGPFGYDPVHVDIIGQVEDAITTRQVAGVAVNFCILGALDDRATKAPLHVGEGPPHADRVEGHRQRILRRVHPGIAPEIKVDVLDHPVDSEII
jgi:hypothetical protein